MAHNEAFSRVVIEALLADQGWNTQDTNSVRYEVVLEDSTRADYVLCDRHGRSLAVIEAKRFSVNPADAAEQARNYARQLNVPYIFLANGQEIRFWGWQREAYPHPVKTFFKQDNLERRAATAQVNLTVNCVPEAIKYMDVEQFDEFLSQRRKLTAKKSVAITRGFDGYVRSA